MAEPNSSADVGFTVLRGGDFRVGVFGGVHYMNQSVSALGCTQTSFNPSVCGAFPLPNQVRVISQENNWYSLRIGMDAAVEIDRFKLSVDDALVPYLWLQGYDTHWLRIGTQPGDFTGPIPEDGTGWGYQLDAFLSYRVTEMLGVGIGGRYWYMQSRGLTHFEERVVGVNTVPQPVEWKTQNFGVFLQGRIKLGSYALFPTR